MFVVHPSYVGFKIKVLLLYVERNHPCTNVTSHFSNKHILLEEKLPFYSRILSVYVFGLINFQSTYKEIGFLLLCFV